MYFVLNGLEENKQVLVEADSKYELDQNVQAVWGDKEYVIRCVLTNIPSGSEVDFID